MKKYVIGAFALLLVVITSCTKTNNADAFVGRYAVSTIENATWGGSSGTLTDNGTMTITKVSSSRIQVNGYFNTFGEVVGNNVYLESYTTTDSSGSLTIVFGTGTLNGNNITVNTDANVLLILDGVTIKSNNPAIYIESAKNAYIKLVNNNKLECETSDDLDACIYSKDDLFIYGSGSLDITSNIDGIASKDDLTIYEGTYNIKSTGDGIKGKDSVTISDGTFNIDSSETSIKTTNEDEKGDLTITGGSFVLNAANDGIHAKGKLEINAGTFDIEGVEGLEATYIVINDGKINIKASDDGINATSKSNANTYTVKIEINGGDINIEMAQGDTDAIDVNGNIYINGGTINITANSAFDYDGTAEKKGGTIIVNGEETTSLQNQMMGGPGGMRENMTNGESPSDYNRNAPPERR